MGKIGEKNRKENAIECFAIGAMTWLLSIFVPRNKIRDACTIFFFKQSVTCFFGLLVVEKNLISYPSRLFFRLFSQTLLLLEREKANCHCFYVETAYYF